MSSQGAFRDWNGPGFELIETLRWEPQAGFVRRERHLARLFRSVVELGFERNRIAIEKVLASVGGHAALRVRLTVAANGAARVTAQSFAPLASDSVWTLRIAETRLNSSDPLLRHKTTRRDLYQAARAEYPVADADEVILLNERREVCDGTITNLFLHNDENGPLLTPRLQAGLLPGILRQELLDAGKAREATLTPADLRAARRLFVGNSLRGLTRARLLDGG
jgi:4-amino-4-deoxychorismate lyase